MFHSTVISVRSNFFKLPPTENFGYLVTTVRTHTALPSAARKTYGNATLNCNKVGKYSA